MEIKFYHFNLSK